MAEGKLAQEPHTKSRQLGFSTTRISNWHGSRPVFAMRTELSSVVSCPKWLILISKDCHTVVLSLSMRDRVILSCLAAKAVMQRDCTDGYLSEYCEAEPDLASNPRDFPVNSRKPRQRLCHPVQGRTDPDSTTSHEGTVATAVNHQKRQHHQSSIGSSGDVATDRAAGDSARQEQPMRLSPNPFPMDEGPYVYSVMESPDCNPFATLRLPPESDTSHLSFPYGDDPTLPRMYDPTPYQAGREWNELAPTHPNSRGHRQMANNSDTGQDAREVGSSTRCQVATTPTPYCSSAKIQPHRSSLYTGVGDALYRHGTLARTVGSRSHLDIGQSATAMQSPSLPHSQNPRVYGCQSHMANLRKRKFTPIRGPARQHHLLLNLPESYRDLSFTTEEPLLPRDGVTQSVWTDDLLGQPVTPRTKTRTELSYPPLPELSDNSQHSMAYFNDTSIPYCRQPSDSIDPLADLFPEEVDALPPTNFGYITADTETYGYFPLDDMTSTLDQSVEVLETQRQARDTSKDELLISLKGQGLSYKQIKKQGNFHEAESTLRGRYRTITKRREERVRKPEWRPEDEKLLLDAVLLALPTTTRNSLYSGSQDISAFGDFQNVNLSKVSWKGVAEQMHRWGCYRFGNATVKKKFDELMRRQ